MTQLMTQLRTTMRYPLMTLLVGLGCGSLGLYIGHRGSSVELRAASTADRAVESATDARAPAPTLCVAALDRQVLREELAGTFGGGAGTEAPVAAPSPAKEAPPPPTPAQVVALDGARQSVDGALARGSLTTEQADDLHDLLMKVDPQSHYNLATELVVALNHGKLMVENGHLPL
jgi:hypothetical protein